MTVVTRFAPSPTGLLHVGGARTALFCWLYARRTGGRFILRIEDTDRERSTAEAVRVILEGMAWLGLDADEGPYYQTQRFDRYREIIRGMLQAGTAYHCYCTKPELDALRERQIARKEKPRYTGICRDRSEPRPGIDPVVRFRNPLHGTVVVQDLVHGPVTFQNAELDDLIIARADGTPTYNFCVVVDDMDMQVTHVIRGDDHLNNTPRQMNMLQALGATLPLYAHVPMILGPDGTKLSKRHGAVSVLQYEEEGYLPDALLNYLVRLGWSHGDQEVFTRAACQLARLERRDDSCRTQRAGDAAEQRARQDRSAGARRGDRHGGVAADRCDTGVTRARAHARAPGCGAGQTTAWFGLNETATTARAASPGARVSGAYVTRQAVPL